MQHRSPTFVGIDIGTSKVRCMIATIDENNAEPSILALSERPNHGMRKGVILEPKEVEQVLDEVLMDAERQAGLPIHGATVNINGAHIQSEASRGVVAISGVGHKITAADRDRVEEAATVIHMPANREIIQVFAKSYRIDGQETVKDPISMQGVRLEVDTQIVTGASPSLHNLEQVFGDLNLVMHNRTASGLAAAEAVLDRQQKESGTVLVDIGAGSTNLAVIEEGEVQYVGVIPVGGQHVTNDLAIGLKTDLDIAERVKIEHAKTIDAENLGSGEVGLSSIEGNSHMFSADDIYMIVTARVEELLELVDKELKRIHKSRKLPGGVVFTGGSSKLPGLEQTARRVLELPAKVAVLPKLGGLVENVNACDHAAVIGLMQLDMLLAPTGRAKSKVSMPSMSGLNTKVSGAIKGVFKRKKQ